MKGERQIDRLLYTEGGPVETKPSDVCCTLYVAAGRMLQAWEPSHHCEERAGPQALGPPFQRGCEMATLSRHTNTHRPQNPHPRGGGSFVLAAALHVVQLLVVQLQLLVSQDEARACY